MGKFDTTSLAEAVSLAAKPVLDDVEQVKSKVEIDTAMEEVLSLVVDVDKPSHALKLVDQVIEKVEGGGDDVTVEMIDRALEISDQLVLELTKDTKKQKRELKSAEDDLDWKEKVGRFLGLKGENIDKANKEAREVVAATKKESRSREQNTELDTAIDDMIEAQLAESSPSFKLLKAVEDDTASVIAAAGVLNEAAEGLSMAGTNDMVDMDTGNDLMNMALEIADNVGVSTSRDEVETAVKALNKLLKKMGERDVSHVQNTLSMFVDMVDVPLEMLNSTGGFDGVDALDLIGAFGTMDDAEKMMEQAEKIEKAYQKRLSDIEKTIASVVAKVRTELGLE
jgi:hypothetical protein